MRAARKITKPKPFERRFPDTEDPSYLAFVVRHRCLISGKRFTASRWRGVYPNKQIVTDEYLHTCDSFPVAHHTDLKAHGGHDRSCVSVCTEAHREIHQHGPDAFEQRWGIVFAVEVEKLQREWKSRGETNQGEVTE